MKGWSEPSDGVEARAGGARGTGGPGRAPRFAAWALVSASLALALAAWGAAPPASPRAATPLPGSSDCAECHGAGARQAKHPAGEAPNFDAAGAARLRARGRRVRRLPRRR